jgi:hypothetical protein
MFVFDEMPDPVLGLGGLEPELSAEEKAVQETAHQFAKEVMRPIGIALDKLTPEDVIAPASPIWSYLQQLKDSGLLDLNALAAMSAGEKARIMPLIFEELGWGDSGLTIAAIALAFPAFAAGMSGNPELVEEFGSSLGCWVGTQPDRGSDAVDWDATEVHPGAGGHPPIQEPQHLLLKRSAGWRFSKDMWRWSQAAEKGSSACSWKRSIGVSDAARCRSNTSLLKASMPLVPRSTQRSFAALQRKMRSFERWRTSSFAG